MDRRSFIKRASGLVAAVAAPLFIPSDRLDFGVPKRQIIVPERQIIVPEPPEILMILGGEVSGLESRLFVGAERTVRFDLVASAPAGASSFGIKLQGSSDGKTWQDISPLQLGETVRFTAQHRYVRTVTTVAGAVTVAGAAEMIG